MERIGYVREVRRGPSIDRQREDLAAAGVGAHAIEDQWEYVALRLRDGDTLMLPSLAVIAPDERTATDRLKDVAKRGVMVHCLDTGHTFAATFAEDWKRARRAWVLAKTCADPAEMRRRGKRGGRPRAIVKGSKEDKAIKALWLNPHSTKTNEMVAADASAILGKKVSTATLARHYGQRPKFTPGGKP